MMHLHITHVSAEYWVLIIVRIEYSEFWSAEYQFYNLLFYYVVIMLF